MTFEIFAGVTAGSGLACGIFYIVADMITGRSKP